jgi:hypothetical protein
MLTLNKTNFLQQHNSSRKEPNTRPVLTRISRMPKGEEVVERWLEYDLVALAVLVFGVAAVEFLALTF